MPNRWICIYECYENGKLIGKGTSDEIAELIGCNRSTVNAYAIAEKPVYDKYTFKKVDTVLVSIEYERKEKPKQEYNDNTLDYLVRHLRKYGNTVMPNRIKPDKYLEVLKEMDLECIVRKIPDVSEGKKRGFYYILEVK